VTTQTPKPNEQRKLVSTQEHKESKARYERDITGDIDTTKMTQTFTNFAFNFTAAA
jgi:hypothetical protein